MAISRCCCWLGCALLALAGCTSNTQRAAEEKDMRAGLQNTKPDLNKMRPQDRAMLEKFMNRPADAPPSAPK